MESPHKVVKVELNTFSQDIIYPRVSTELMQAKNGRYHRTRTKGVAPHVDFQSWYGPDTAQLNKIRNIEQST